MEPASKDNILDSKANPNALQDIKKFVKSFHKYLLKTESIQGAVCHFEDKDPNIVSTPQPDSMQSPYDTICKALGSNYPCLYEPIRELCLYIFSTLTKGLKEDQLSLTEDETHDLADALEALMFIAVYVKTATKLYTCRNHQDKIMGNLDWPAPLIRKLIPYLVQNMDSTTRIDIVLLRTLEIIVNPPQAFGSSKLWLTIMREIEEDFILEDSQQSKFLSLLFVMLSTEARVRLCGIYQEQLQQLLDADTLPTLSLEILTLIYYMSSNSKTQQALIKNGVHTVLIDWMTECFMARKDLSKDNGQDKFDIVTQIFLNLVQGLGKTALDEVVSFVQNRAVAHYIRYEKSDIFEEVMSPILSILPFSSFVPVTLNIGGHLSGNDILNLKDEPTASLFEDRLLSNLDAKQSRNLKELIARHHLKLEPFEKFIIEWTQFDKERHDFVESMRTADSVLITCMHIPLGRIAKIGFYVGAGFRVDRNGFLVSNTSKENFLFIYLDSGEINLLDIDFEIRMNQTWEPFSFDIKDLATDMLILTCPNDQKSNVLICNSLLRRLCKEYGKVAFKGDVQFSRECINLWLGNTSIDLYKNRPRECIYGPNYLASDLRHSLQLLRPNNHTYFVPKDLTLKEFLRPVLPKCEKILDTLLVYHEQHIVTLSTKLVDLKLSTESQSLFQIQDLRIVCLDHPEQLCQAIMTPPIETYKTIMPQYYSKLKTPVLNHLLAEGGSLDILKKIAPGRTLGTDFLTAHQIILEKIGPYAPALGSVMGKDIIMILYQILFIRCEDKKFIPRILQKAILKYMQQAQLQSADPHQLHAFLDSAIADVLEKDVVHEKSASRLVEKYNLLLQELKDADLIQDSYLVGLLLSTLFKGEDALGAKGLIITQNLSKPLKYCSQIEELLTEGFDIIIPYCTDQVCNRNFTRLAQSVTAFMNIKGYPLALTLSEFFLETLSDLILQFKKQKKGANFVLYVDSTIEEIMLKLIHFDFTTLSKVLQAKQDLASEVDVYEVLDQSLNVFNFLQDELKKIHDRKNIASTQVEMLVETVESASIVLKILAHEQVLLSQGFEAANDFSLQYLAKMESTRTAQTLAQVFSLLDSINDDGLFFQTLASILELLEAWSKNKVLVNMFDTKVRDPKNEESVKTVPFFEYYMTFSKKLESANQIAQLIAQNNEIDKEELKANKKAVIVRVFALFKSIQENLNNR